MKTTVMVLFLLSLAGKSFSQNRGLYDTLAHTEFEEFMHIRDKAMEEKLDSIRDYSKGLDKQKWKVVELKWKKLSDYRKEYNSPHYRSNSDTENLKEKWETFTSYLNDNKKAFFPDAYDSSLIKRMDTLKANIKLVSDTAQIIFRMDSAFIDTIYRKVDSIQKRTRIIDTTTKRVDITTDSIKGSINSIVLPNQDSLKYFLYKRDTTIKKLITAAGYRDGLYSVGYSQVFGNATRLSPLIMSAEFFFPFNSQNYKHAGGFFSAGVQYKAMAFLTGIGCLSNDTRQNISWKGSFFYFPYRSPFGFGLTYSPLTSIGILVIKKI